MSKLLQLVVGSFGFSGVYALTALSLVFIFKTSSVVNFAFGAVGTVVALLLWTFFSAAHLPLYVAWPLAVVGALALGAVLEVGLLRRIERQPLLIQVVLTLGLTLFIEGLAGLVWSYRQKNIPLVVNGHPVSIFGADITPDALFIFLFSLAAGVAAYVIFERTRLGLAARAVAHSREVASLMGIKTHRVVTVSWAVGVLLAGLAAILVSPAISLTPNTMDNITVYAFAGAVLGGFGSITGAVVGGVVVGMLSNLVAGYLSTNLQLPLVFALIVVVLYVRPQGLFGAREAVRQ